MAKVKRARARGTRRWAMRARRRPPLFVRLMRSEIRARAPGRNSLFLSLTEGIFTGVLRCRQSLAQ